jgi:hypothetical protein
MFTSQGRAVETLVDIYKHNYYGTKKKGKEKIKVQAIYWESFLDFFCYNDS